VTFTLPALSPPRVAMEAVRAVRRSPATAVFALILLVTTILLRTSVHPSAILRDVSTNVANLSRVPVRAVIGSALVLDGGPWLAYAFALALTLGSLERRVGTLWALGVFASGHVIATVLTEGWIWIAIKLGALPLAERTQIDVGVSYGLLAAAGAATALLPRRLRWVPVSVAGLVVAVPLVWLHDMTSFGHLLALLIGLAWWPLILRRDAERHVSSSR
jgi:hypothetical protein